MNVKYFGRRLMRVRKNRNLTQKELAKVLYVTVGTISNYETGVHLPDIEKLTALADYFNVTADYLLGRCKFDFSLDMFEEVLLM